MIIWHNVNHGASLTKLIRERGVKLNLVIPTYTHLYLKEHRM